MKICVFGFGKPDSKLHIAHQLSDVLYAGLVEEPTQEQLDVLLREDGIDIAIVNVDNGLDNVKRIAHRSERCKVIGVGNGTDGAQVIAAMNAGCSHFVPCPVSVADIQEAIDAIRAANGTRMSKRLCIVGSSGAAGATTVACHMVSELGALSGAVIVDLDLELGDVATAFDVEPDHCLASICQSSVDTPVDTAMLSRSVIESGPVSILARPKSIGEIGAVTSNALSSIFMTLAEMFPYVVVDLSRPNGELGQAAMRGADSVVVVAQADVMSIRNASRSRDAAIAAGVEPKNVRLILNRCGASGHKVSEADATAMFEGELLAKIPNEWTAVREALDLGRLLPKESKAGAAIRLAARTLVGVRPAKATKKRGRLLSGVRSIFA